MQLSQRNTVFMSLTSSSRAVKGTADQRKTLGHTGYDSFRFQYNIRAGEKESLPDLDIKGKKSIPDRKPECFSH